MEDRLRDYEALYKKQRSAIINRVEELEEEKRFLLLQLDDLYFPKDMLPSARRRLITIEEHLEILKGMKE